MFRTTRPSSAVTNNNGGANSEAATCRQEALQRSNRNLSNHHPNVKLPPRLEEKSKEEQIQRCCARFKSQPKTVDTLIRSIFIISENPLKRKYRRIDRANPGYQRTLAEVPGAEQLLRTLGFVRRDSQTLVLDKVDKSLMQHALQTLEATKVSTEYQQAKTEQEFAKDVIHHLKVTPTDAELFQRQALLSKVPQEPPKGRAAVMMIHLGDSRLLTRRFDGDDTLQDVLHWLGGTAGVVFYDQVSSGKWSLVDVNRHGGVPLDCQTSGHKTLQHLGFWPSGRLVLRPSAILTISQKVELGESRGLGSAPMN